MADWQGWQWSHQGEEDDNRQHGDHHQLQEQINGLTQRVQDLQQQMNTLIQLVRDSQIRAVPHSQVVQAVQAAPPPVQAVQAVQAAPPHAAPQAAQQQPCQHGGINPASADDRVEASDQLQRPALSTSALDPLASSLAARNLIPQDGPPYNRFQRSVVGRFFLWSEGKKEVTVHVACKRCDQYWRILLSQGRTASAEDRDLLCSILETQF
jgi:hypothetical protein